MNLLFALTAAFLLGDVETNAPAASAMSAEPAPLQLSVDDVRDRVERFDPLARARALEQLRAEIILRRSEWNRVSGSVGINASYGGYISGFGSVPNNVTETSFFHRLTANLTAQIVFPIYAGGGISAAIESAEARLEAAKADKRVTNRDLKRAALVVYAQLVSSEEQLAIATTALARSASLVDVAKRRLASGISTESDVARVELNRVRRAGDVESRRGERDLAAALLRAALMLPQTTPIAATDSLEVIRTLRQQGDADRRPELLSLDAQLIASRADRRVQFANYLPRVELFAQAAYGNGQPFFLGGLALDLGAGVTQLFGVFSGNAQGGVRLSWTGWDFFVTRDNVARAEAEAAIAETRLADQARLYEREVAEANARSSQAERRLDALKDGKEFADKAVQLARIRYETGNALLTEVLDAELEAISVVSQRVQAEYDAAVAHLDGLRASGREL